MVTAGRTANHAGYSRWYRAVHSRREEPRALPASAAVDHASPPGPCLNRCSASGGAECGKAARSDLGAKAEWLNCSTIPLTRVATPVVRPSHHDVARGASSGCQLLAQVAVVSQPVAAHQLVCWSSVAHGATIIGGIGRQRVPVGPATDRSGLRRPAGRPGGCAAGRGRPVPGSLLRPVRWRRRS